MSSIKAIIILLVELAWGLFAVIILLKEQIAKGKIWLRLVRVLRLLRLGLRLKLRLFWLKLQLWWVDTKTSCSGLKKVLGCLIVAFIVVSIGYQILNRVYIESIYTIFPCLNIVKHILAGSSIDLAKIGTIYISLAPPLYYFYFKEQRAVSESFMTDVEVPILNVFVVCCIGSGLLFLDTENRKIDTVFDLIYLMILAFWVAVFIRNLMQRLRPKFIMEKAVEEAEVCMHIILAVSKGKIKMKNHEQALHRRLNLAFEIYYQILTYAIQKNVHEIIQEGIASSEKLFGLLNEIIKEKAEDVTPEDLFYYNFRLILRNHKNFCVSLHEDKRSIEFQDALQLFFRYYPQGLDLTDDGKNLLIIDEFFKTYWSMLLYFISSNRNIFQRIADEILVINKLDNEATDIVLTLRALIINSVDEDNLTHLVETCYLQKKLVDNMYKLENLSKGNDFFSRLNISSKKRRSQNYEGMQLYVLFQAMIKATELSQYKMVGFLIKYVASNYKPDMINNVYDNVLQNEGYIDPRLHVEEFFKRLGVKFNINRETVVYCLKKVVILLRLQEMHLSRITVDEMISLDIFGDGKDMFSFQYCLKKVLSVKEQYGMVSLNDERLVWELEYLIYSKVN
jgi:hypothetical protein